MEETWRETDLTNASGTLFGGLRTPRNRKTGAIAWRSRNRNLLLKIAQNVLKMKRGDLNREMPFLE